MSVSSGLRQWSPLETSSSERSSKSNIWVFCGGGSFRIGECSALGASGKTAPRTVRCEARGVLSEDDDGSPRQLERRRLQAAAKRPRIQRKAEHASIDLPVIRLLHASIDLPVIRFAQKSRARAPPSCRTRRPEPGRGPPRGPAARSPGETHNTATITRD